MDKYTYEARDKSGRLVKGMIEADSLESAEDVLKYNQLTVISVKPSLGFDERLMATLRSFFGGIKSKDKAIFARQMSTMINAGLPLMEALKYLVKQGTNKQMVIVIAKIVAYIEKGKSFSFALAQFPDIFSPIFISMVKSGEASGKLDKVLDELADQLESDYALRSKIRGALIYPGFILFAMFGVGFFSLIYVIPQLEDVFTSSGAELPLITLFLVKLSNFINNFWYLVLLILIGLIVFLRYFFMTSTGKYYIAYVNLNLPVFKKINTGIYVTSFSKTLGLLMAGGVPIIKSLSMVSEAVGNVIIENELKESVFDVEKGIPLSQPLSKSKFFPPLVSSMVAVGEQTGQLDKILLNIAQTYEEETEAMLKGLSSLLEPIIMLIVGIGVAFLAIAIIMPIYQLSSVF